MLRKIGIAMLMAGAAVCAGCLTVVPPAPPQGGVVAVNRGTPGQPGSAVVAFGNTMVTNNVCAGQVTLNGGSLTLSDPCFTGESNIVLCSDSSAAKPVRCASRNGYLTVTGSGNDVINYARVQ